MSSKLDKIADRYQEFEDNEWVELSTLSRQHQAVHLGSGSPDFKPPQFVIDQLRKITEEGTPAQLFQYPRTYGHIRLANVLSTVFSPLLGRKIDPITEITITLGAGGSLYNAFQGNINPGDEVIIIEPYFYLFIQHVKTAGGIPVFVTLSPTKTEATTSADWTLNKKELESKFNCKTKAIVVNNPNNPLGKVFTREELEFIAELCQKHDVLCIADEVYEWLVYDHCQHVRIATLPGMWERTLTIGSAGKTFSSTGWKVGWTIGPARLIKHSNAVHHSTLYGIPTPLQESIAATWEFVLPQMNAPESYFRKLSQSFQGKRDRLVRVLQDLGMSPIIPQGGYFIMADISNFASDIPDDENNDSQDIKFVRWMIKEKKLSAMPASAFYTKEQSSSAEKYVRLCFIKEDSTLIKAEEILKKWAKSLDK